MRKRVPAQSGGGNASSSSRLRAKAKTTGGQEKKGAAPFLFDLSRPAELSLNHTINMYLTPEEGISLGVWHTVPDSEWKEAQGKDLSWYRSALQDGSPVVIYLHGYGDSTGKPTEESLTTDAVWLYHWAKKHSGGSRVILWGHSLGSGVTTNTAVRLMEQGVIVDGVILDGAFINIPSRAPLNPFVLCALSYWEAVERFLLRDTMEKDIKFPNDENVEKMRSPLLFLHSEDDHLAGIHLARQMYETARSVQDPERVRMAVFEGSHGYLHNGLYRDPRLPAIIKSFVESTEEM
ncbi:hypothetical protein CRUP_013716 [Coryphaenoides rupestris]|nr:hypothetical protein CRUP_013716 [Coryphaenoides rupestris]